MGIIDHESHLGYVAAGDAVVLGHANELTGTLGYQGQMFRAFLFDEAGQLAFR